MKTEAERWRGGGVELSSTVLGGGQKGNGKGKYKLTIGMIYDTR